ncbi:glycosyltransferase family 4 protein [Candidatus Uhrbacteria bacterium]|nr:glycosyltransferase family 4 protein [Candidatus Uhrbacteria bacterium]
MRILIVSQYFWPEVFRVNDLAEEFVRRGHDITVLTGVPNYPSGRAFDGYSVWRGPWREDRRGVHIVRVPLVTRGRNRSWQLALNYLSFAALASIFGSIRCGRRFDAIFVFEVSPVTVGIPAIVMRWVTGAPIAFWVQDLWPESLTAAAGITSRFVLTPAAALVRWIYRRCDRILVQSEAFTADVVTHGGDPARITYVPNWAEDIYHPIARDAARLPTGLVLPDGFRVVFAGNIGAAQGFGTILDAAERTRDLPDLHWVVFGDGRERSWVEEEVARRGLDRFVHLLGRYPVETMPHVFAHADALLVTLRRDPIFAKTIPGKVQSYLACGKPILAAIDGEGARIVAVSGSGIAVPADDGAALADAVRHLYGMNARDREAMGQRGRVYYEQHFARTMLIDRIEHILGALARARSPA